MSRGTVIVVLLVSHNCLLVAMVYIAFLFFDLALLFLRLPLFTRFVVLRVVANATASFAL